MGKLLLIPGLAGALLLAAPAPARAGDLEDQLRERFHIEGIDKLKQGFEQLLRSIPRFSTPYLNEHGDIVIPRLPPPERPFEPWFDRPPPEPDFADT